MLSGVVRNWLILLRASFQRENASLLSAKLSNDLALSTVMLSDFPDGIGSLVDIVDVIVHDR